MAKLYKVVFVALCVAALFSGSASAACRFRCISGFTTSPGGGQPSDWGMGPDCATAQSAFSSSVFNTADNNCVALGYDGVCGIVYEVITSQGPNGCFFNGTMMQVDGYANHSCGREICIDPIDPYQ
jgi:hypothetical protein